MFVFSCALTSINWIVLTLEDKKNYIKMLFSLTLLTVISYPPQGAEAGEVETIDVGLAGGAQWT